MAYKLKSENGNVGEIKKAGSVFVKYTMPEGKAKGMIETGKYEKSDRFPGFGICVGEEYYFAGSVTAEKEPVESEEKPKKKTVTKKK